jgi:hypothetical protein
MKVRGLDVHKDTIFCTIYDWRSYSDVKDYESITYSVCELGKYLQEEDVQQVAMESTSIYWTPVWDILEEMKLVYGNPVRLRQKQAV